MRAAHLLPLLSLMLATAAPAQSPESRQHLVWLEPASTLVGLAVGLDDPGQTPYSQRTAVRLLALSGGYARALTGGRALSLQAFVADHRQGCGVPEACDGFTSVRASVGLAQSFGGAPHRGFFLEPRLIFGYVREHGGFSDPDLGPQRYHPGFNGYSAQAGLDVGYQWQLGRFYVAPMLGLAVGASYNVGGIEPFITSNTYVSAPDDRVQLALGLNLHLLRVGWML